MNTKQVRVGCLTWNCAGKPPPEDFDMIESIVLPDPQSLKTFSQNNTRGAQDYLPQFYIVGLQEMVNLEVVGSLLCSKDLDRMNKWEQLIAYGLN